jgi:Cu(I)/Ag(I) efflux system membrane fusion protein
VSRTIKVVVTLVVVAALGFGAWLLREPLGLVAAPARDEPAGSGDRGEHAGHGATDPSMATDEPRIPIDVVPTQQARIGVKVTPVVRGPVHQTIRAVGLVTASERLEAHVHTRIAGYIERLHVNAVGDRVARGQALYRLYSPEVVATEYEYAAAAGRGELSAMLAQAALDRLALWDVPSSELARLRKTRKPQRTITFTSPVQGFVLDKDVLRGMYVTPEMELYHIADLSVVWVIVTLYEHELPTVDVGDPVQITLAGLPGVVIDGVISYLYPEVDLATRTAKARVEVPNEELLLKPGMYARVTLSKDLGEALLVPEDAVIDTGVRRLVFVHVAPDRFEPREVELGPRVSEGRVVRTGVSADEEVVVRAGFLIDAESRLQAALARGDAAPGHSGHGDHSSH